MKITICTPSSRWWNLIHLKHTLQRASIGSGVSLTWLIVFYDTQFPDVPAEVISDLKCPWINILVIPAPTRKLDPCYHKLNCALDSLAGHDEWFWFIADDNLLPKSCLSKLRGQAENYGKPAMVASMKRGQVKTWHDKHDLIASRHNVVIGGITGEQYLMKLDFIGKTRFDYGRNGCADASFAEDLFREHPKAFHFIPDLFIPFNALEPVRWDFVELEKVLTA